MPYYVTVTTARDERLTMEIKDSETLESTVRWIERLRANGVTDPVLYWVTVDGQHWCLEPASLVGEVEVSELQQPAEAVTN